MWERACSRRGRHKQNTIRISPMNTTESLKDYQRVRLLAIRSLFEIIEQSSEGTVIVDRDANIVWMNERYARRFGLQSAEVAIGKPCERSEEHTSELQSRRDLVCR